MLSWDEETVLALCAKVLKTICFCCNVVVAVPMEVLVCVGGFSVNCGAEGVVWLYGD